MPLSGPLPAESYLARHRQLAPCASIRVSPLCLGTMAFGELQMAQFGEVTKETAFAILDYFYQQGGNFLDTANGYQAGQTETWLGEWMASRQNRDEMVIATKYTNPLKPMDSVIQSNYIGNGSKSMRISVDASLKKLQTNYIDVLYIHWWDYSASIPEVMQSLNDLVKSGKVLYLGISDAPAWVVSKANQYARDHGLRQFSVYSSLWNVGIRDLERDVIPMCLDEGMGIAPFGVLGEGRFQTQKVMKERETNNPGRNFQKISEQDRKISLVLENMATKRDLPLTSIALAYVMQKAPYVFPVVGVRTLDHIKRNHEALAITLSDEEIKQIESAYDFSHGIPHTYLSGSHIDGGASRHATKPEDVWITKALNMDWVDREARPIPNRPRGEPWNIFKEMNMTPIKLPGGEPSKTSL